MNEYFELLHKGCNDLSIFFIDVLVFLIFVLVVYLVVVMIWVLVEVIKGIDWENVAYRFDIWLAQHSDDELFDATWMDAEKYQETRLPELKRKHYQTKH